MRYASPGAWKIVLPTYGALGLLAGSGWAQHLADVAWKKPGLGTFAVINLVLPVAAAVLAMIYPRWWAIAIGAVLLTAGDVTSTMIRAFSHRFWDWTFPMWLQVSHPIQIAATAGYAVIGLMVGAAVRPWRRVGKLPIEGICICGYSLEGLNVEPCPECGRRAPAPRNASAAR